MKGSKFIKHIDIFFYCSLVITILTVFTISDNNYRSRAEAQIITELQISTDKLYQKKKEAVIVINIYKTDQGVIGHGTGTFITKDGLFVTNLHVAEYLFSSEFRLEIKGFNGERFPNVELISCSDKRHIDLCLFKAPLMPKAYFPVNSDPITLGHVVYKIGHSYGNYYNLTTGYTIAREDNLPFIFNYSYNDNREVEFIEVSAILGPGDSGGPVFDSRGTLLGISTLEIKDDKEHSRFMAISAREIFNYLQARQSDIKNAKFRHVPLLSSEEISKLQNELSQKMAPPAFIPLVSMVPCSELKSIIKQNRKLKIIDVRTTADFMAGHLENAINIPYIENSKKTMDFILDQDQFDLSALKKIASSSDTLIIYCEGGNSWKSYKAINYIRKKLDWDKIKWLREGYGSCRSKNLGSINEEKKL